MGMNFRKRGGGGGFLHNTDGVIESYAVELTKWDGSKGEYFTHSLKLMVKPDGADEAVPQFLAAGFFYKDSASVSKDGQTISGIDKAGDEVELPYATIEEGSAAARFVASVEAAAEAAGIEVDLPDNGAHFNGLNNLRVTFVKVLDREAQIDLGRARIAKKKGKKAGEQASDDDAYAAGKDKGSDGNDYNLDFLTVGTVLGYAETKKAGKGSKAAAPVVKKAKTAKVEESDDIEVQAKDVLLAILKAAKDKTILRSQVSGKVVAHCNENEELLPIREELREVLFSETFLKQEDGWNYDGKDRKQPITLG